MCYHVLSEYYCNMHLSLIPWSGFTSVLIGDIDFLTCFSVSVTEVVWEGEASAGDKAEKNVSDTGAANR